MGRIDGRKMLQIKADQKEETDYDFDKSIHCFKYWQCITKEWWVQQGFNRYYQTK
jgi:hypothetical protein